MPNFREYSPSVWAPYISRCTMTKEELELIGNRSKVTNRMLEERFFGKMFIHSDVRADRWMGHRCKMVVEAEQERERMFKMVTGDRRRRFVELLHKGISPAESLRIVFKEGDKKWPLTNKPSEFKVKLVKNAKTPEYPRLPKDEFDFLYGYEGSVSIDPVEEEQALKYEPDPHRLPGFIPVRPRPLPMFPCRLSMFHPLTKEDEEECQRMSDAICEAEDERIIEEVKDLFEGGNEYVYQTVEGELPRFTMGMPPMVRKRTLLKVNQKFVYHGTSVENADKILKKGRIWPKVKKAPKISIWAFIKIEDAKKYSDVVFQIKLSGLKYEFPKSNETAFLDNSIKILEPVLADKFELVFIREENDEL